MQGDPGMKGVLATRVSGSADLYQVFCSDALFPCLPFYPSVEDFPCLVISSLNILSFGALFLDVLYLIWIDLEAVGACFASSGCLSDLARAIVFCGSGCFASTQYQPPLD